MQLRYLLLRALQQFDHRLTLPLLRSFSHNRMLALLGALSIVQDRIHLLCLFSTQLRRASRIESEMAADSKLGMAWYFEDFSKNMTVV